MERSANLGTNRTGVQTSPKDVQAMLDSAREGAAPSPMDESALAAARMSYYADADPLGSVPTPGTLKGAVKSGAKMLTGKRPQVFIDKLAERLAFERSGVRLYEALLAKLQSKASKVPGVSEQRLREIHDQEADHFAMLVDCMQTLGADPTAQTPSADLVGVESMGLMQEITDARTTFAQSLHAILVAELTDVDGWDVLIALAEQVGQQDMAQRFRTALQTEQDHLDQVRTWVAELTLGEARPVAPRH